MKEKEASLAQALLKQQRRLECGAAYRIAPTLGLN